MHTNVPARPQIRFRSFYRSPFVRQSRSVSRSPYSCCTSIDGMHTVHTHRGSCSASQPPPCTNVGPFCSVLSRVLYSSFARVIYMSKIALRTALLSGSGFHFVPILMFSSEKEIKKQFHSNLFSFCITHPKMARSLSVCIRSLNQHIAYCVGDVLPKILIRFVTGTYFSRSHTLQHIHWK